MEDSVTAGILARCWVISEASVGSFVPFGGPS